jgi:hypothetical protein
VHEAEQQSAFYVIERIDGASRLYMADRSCGWTSNIDLAAKWDKRSTAKDVWQRQPCQLRGTTAVREYTLFCATRRP